MVICKRKEDEDSLTFSPNLAKRMVFIFFILTLLSSLSAAIFVNADINLASAKKSSHSGGDDSNDTGNGDSIGSTGSNSDKGTSGTTTTPSIAQGTTTTTTPSIAQGNITSSATSINGAPLTPKQQYEQCLSGIGGGIPGNCKPPSTTTLEQNVSPQTLTPQQICQDGSTPSANGICFSPAPVTPACPTNQIRDDRGNCILSPNAQPNIKNGSYVIDLGGGRFQLLTFPPISNTNTISPVCPQGTQLYFNKCVSNLAVCPPGTAQDEDDITCSPAEQTKQVQVTVNPDGTCPVGAYSVGSSGNAGQPGTGSIICLKNVPVVSPPATPPSNTPSSQP